MHHVRIEMKQTDSNNFTDANPKKKKKNKGGTGKSIKPTRSASFENSKEPNQMFETFKDVKFFAGNPSIEVTEGIFHLYKDETENMLHKETKGDGPILKPLPEKRSELVLILSVPIYMTPSDFAAFTGSFPKKMSHMRVIRNESSHSYMVLIKLVDQESADQFYLEYNGKQFHSMEPETCTVLFVASVEFVKPRPDAPLFPLPGAIELPICPVCLERLDEASSGVLTVLCNHSFHSQCISKWKTNNSCPVCRYCQQPEGECPVCSVCKTTESLWICLICGTLGCGRYLNEHARQHYKETQHRYALELQTNRVWDYAGDGYVHRLIVENEGKLVEYRGAAAVEVDNPSELSNNNSKTSNEEMSVHYGGPQPDMSKMESISLEYSYLLDTQRRFFEEQIRRIEEQRNKKLMHLEEEYAELLQSRIEYQQKISQLMDEKRTADRKITQLEKKMKDVLRENEDLRAMNQALQHNEIGYKAKLEDLQKQMNEKIAIKDKTVQELQEQINDLMFFIETKEKVDANPELANGQVVVSPTKKNDNSTPRRKTRQRNT